MRKFVLILALAGLCALALAAPVMGREEESRCPRT